MAISRRSLKYFQSMYDESFCNQLLDWCSQGRSIESFAAEINVIPDVFSLWVKEHINFEMCVHVGYWKSYAYWEEMALVDSKLKRDDKTLNPQIRSEEHT